MTLLERLQALTGPDREVDALIAARFKIYHGQCVWVQQWPGEWRAIEGAVHLLGPNGSRGNFIPTNFTGSIDAAMTILQQYNSFRIARILDDLFGVEIVTDSCPWIDALGATPAIALCIAIVKAEETQHEQ